MSPPARAEVERLIALDTRYDNFPESCTFADHPRQRRAGHFLNLPRGAGSVTTDDCPLAEDCLFRALEEDLAVLANTDLEDEDRLLALKLLAHWVGDFHQLLHVSFADDRGGNQVLEQGGPCDNNLHSTWDTCLIKERIGTDAEANATQLATELTDAERAQWRHDVAVEWANESFQITLTPSVEYCIRQQGACWYSSDNLMLQDDEPRRRVTVDSAYMDAQVDTVKLRLKQAAVRLAAVLDRALQP
jgi:hypothetical protein